MSETKNNNQPIKCPHCACIFLTSKDLQTHLGRFGENKAQHEEFYRRTHGRLEHGYGEE
jgi:hypothetical protein